MSSPCCRPDVRCAPTEQPHFEYFYGRDGYENVTQDQCCAVETPRSQCCNGFNGAALSEPVVGRPLCNTCGDTENYRQCSSSSSTSTSTDTSPSTYNQCSSCSSSDGYGQSAFSGADNGVGCCKLMTPESIDHNVEGAAEIEGRPFNDYNARLETTMYGQCCTGGGNMSSSSVSGDDRDDQSQGSMLNQLTGSISGSVNSLFSSVNRWIVFLLVAVLLGLIIWCVFYRK